MEPPIDLIVGQVFGVFVHILFMFVEFLGFYDAHSLLKHHAIGVGHDFVVLGMEDDMEGFDILYDAFTGHFLVVDYDVVPNFIWEGKKHDNATGNVA